MDNDQSTQTQTQDQSPPAAAPAQSGDLADRIAKLESAVSEIQPALDRIGFASANSHDDAAKRLAAIEGRLARGTEPGELDCAAINAQLRVLTRAVEVIAGHISNDGSDIQTRVQDALRA